MLVKEVIQLVAFLAVFAAFEWSCLGLHVYGQLNPLCAFLGFVAAANAVACWN